MSENLFIIASRKKYRFPTSRGTLMAEDLWDLPLPDLDNAAVALADKIAKASSRSFLDRPDRKTAAQIADDNGLEILKFVINTRQEEAKAAKVRAERRSEIEFLRGLEQKRRLEKLDALPVEEIEQRIRDLQAEDDEGSVPAEPADATA